MKIVNGAVEMKEALLKNKDSVIGTAIEVAGGFTYLAIGINEQGIVAVPLDNFLELKSEMLDKRLEEVFSADKIQVAKKTIEKRRREINKIYS